MRAPQYSQEDEQYRFYRLYSIDFDSVKHSLRLLRRYRRPDIRFCILRELVVAYVRPFSGNTRIAGGKHRLSLKFVPQEHRELHRELVELRMRLLAHTDYTYRQPKVSKWETDRGPVFPMSFRGPDYVGLVARATEIEQLVVAVEAELHAAIREIEAVA